MAWLAALSHEKVTDSEMGSLLERLEARDDLDESEQANVRGSKTVQQGDKTVSRVRLNLCTST